MFLGSKKIFEKYLKKNREKIWWVKKNVYLCIPFRKGGKQQTKFIDNTERDNEVKRDYSLIRIEVFSSCKGCNFIGKRVKHETLNKVVKV